MFDSKQITHTISSANRHWISYQIITISNRKHHLEESHFVKTAWKVWPFFLSIENESHIDYAVLKSGLI